MSEPMVRIITPPVASTRLQLDLVDLTRQIAAVDEDAVAHGALGGEFGYAAHWDNDVFLMHPYCWCEKPACRWCSGCPCPSGDYEFYVDGKRVTSNQQWKWSEKLLGKLPYELYEYGTPEYRAYSKAWNALVRERNRRSWTIYPARKHTCQPTGLMVNTRRRRSWKPRQQAPNFWHKATDLHIWWYKWIGRDMELWPRPPSVSDWEQIVKECAATIDAGALMQPGEAR